MPAPGLRRDGDYRRTLPKPARQVPLRLDDVELRDIPFREHRQRRAARLARDVGDGEILLDDSLGRIEQHERDVGPLRRLSARSSRVVLDPLPLLAAAPQAGSVDEHEGRLAPLQHRVDRVARRARHLGDDDALPADEPVEERRFADVRAPEDRDADRLRADRDLPRAGQPRDDLVEQIAGAVAVQPRERPRLAEAEPWKTADSLSRRGSSILLASTSTGRLLAQDHRELLVARRDTHAGVDDEQHEIRLSDCGECLLGDLRAERPSVRLVHPTRVDQPEPRARPLAEKLLAVSRDSRRLMHDGGASLGEPVDQRRLADVREADDRNGTRDLRGASTSSARPESTWSCRRRRVRATEACISTSQSQSPRIFVCSDRRRLLVALPPFGKPSKRHGSPQAIETGWKLPGLQRLRAVHGDRDDRDAFLQGHHRGARLYVAGDAGSLARALDEEAERETVAHDLPHRPHRVAVGLAAPHRRTCRTRGSTAEARDAMRLDLRHVVDRPRAGGTERRRVEPVEVVARDHEPARRGHALLAVDLAAAGDA